MLGMRDAQPKYHQSTTDRSPVWRHGAIANRCVQNSGVKDGKGAYDFTDHLAAYTKRVLFIAGDKNEVIGVAFQERQYSIPGEVGARASKLYSLLARGHYETQLSMDELRRITLWLDANSNFYGAYTAAAEQAHGKAVQPRWGRPPGLAMER